MHPFNLKTISYYGLTCYHHFHPPHSAAFMCQWIGSVLVQIMACRLFRAKSLSNQCWVIVNRTLRNILQWNLNQTNRPHWWLIQNCSVNDLVPSGNKPLPEPMLTEIFVALYSIPYTAPLCSRNVHTCAHFCYKMVHLGIWDWCIVGFVRLVLLPSFNTGRVYGIAAIVKTNLGPIKLGMST